VRRGGWNLQRVGFGPGIFLRRGSGGNARLVERRRGVPSRSHRKRHRFDCDAWLGPVFRRARVWAVRAREIKVQQRSATRREGGSPGGSGLRRWLQRVDDGRRLRILCHVHFEGRAANLRGNGMSPQRSVSRIESQVHDGLLNSPGRGRRRELLGQRPARRRRSLSDAGTRRSLGLPRAQIGSCGHDRAILPRAGTGEGKR
jgi:hypothetical protein